jgi:hypothetical protein
MMKSEEEGEFKRLNFKRLVPAAYRAMLALESYVHETGLEPSLLEPARVPDQWLCLLP